MSRPANDNPETNRQAEDDLLQEDEGTGAGDNDGEREDDLTEEDEQ